jgi:hypothetical protein
MAPPDGIRMVGDPLPDGSSPPIIHEARANIDKEEKRGISIDTAIKQRSPYMMVREDEEPVQPQEGAPTAGGADMVSGASADDAVAFIAKASGVDSGSKARVRTSTAPTETFFEEPEELEQNKVKDIVVTLGTMLIMFVVLLAVLYGGYRVVSVTAPGIASTLGGAKSEGPLYNITCAGFSACPDDIMEACGLEGEVACVDINNAGPAIIPGTALVKAGVSVAGESGMHTYNADSLRIVNADGTSCDMLAGCTWCLDQEWAEQKVKTLVIQAAPLGELKTGRHSITPGLDRANLLQDCKFGTDLV